MSTKYFQTTDARNAVLVVTDTYRDEVWGGVIEDRYQTGHDTVMGGTLHTGDQEALKTAIPMALISIADLQDAIQNLFYLADSLAIRNPASPNMSIYELAERLHESLV
jgi:hypothetical protein